MKLYVWEHVLTDYTDGIMFALAPNVKTARRLILEKAGLWDTPGYKETELYRDLMGVPKVYTESVGFYLYGGS